MDYSEWKQEFADVATRLASAGVPFTSEDVVAKVGLPSGEQGMNRNNAVGAAMTALSARKVIAKTGRRVRAQRRASHGAELTEWVGIGAASKYQAVSPNVKMALIQRIEAVRILHRPTNPLRGTCVECHKPYPCPTARLIR